MTPAQIAELLAAEGITGTPDRIADFTTQLHEHIHGVWDPDGEPAPVPQPDEQPQPIAA